MRFDDRAIDQMQTVARFRCEDVENLRLDTAPRRTIEAIIRRRVRAIAFRPIAPRYAGAQQVEDRVHDLAVVNAGALLVFRQ
jgi:hypothetical protein